MAKNTKTQTQAAPVRRRGSNVHNIKLKNMIEAYANYKGRKLTKQETAIACYFIDTSTDQKRG